MLARYLALFIISIFLTNSLVIAEAKNFKVYVRSIEGTGEVTKAGVVLNDKLEDIREELEHLSFSKFDLLKGLEVTIPLDEKKELDLGGKHKLIVKPLRSDSGKVCMWLHWFDMDGMEVLDTKIHVSEGENFITGLEDKEHGKILAIRVVSLEN